MKTNIINGIVSVIKSIISKLSFKDFILLALVLLAGFYYMEYKHYYNKSLTPIVIYDTDSLFIYKNKLKEVYKEKEIYVQNIKDLKGQNTLLSNEINKLKDNPVVVTKTELKVKLDTVLAKSDTIIIQPKDSLYKLKWSKYDNQYYCIEGQTNVKSDFSRFETLVTNLELTTNLTLDVIEKNKTLQIIGKTDNPYVNIMNMDGVVLDPSKNPLLKKYYKQKKWSIGPQIGIGVTKDKSIQPYLGIGLQYGIIHF